MELNEFQGIVGQIGQNLSNQALVTTLLSQLVDDYTAETATKATLLDAQSKHDETVKGLQATNMQLFLKVANPTPEVKLNSAEPLSYDDLITEMGGNK